MKLILRFIYALLGIAILILASGWLILATPFFSELRRSTAETVLSKQIGQAIEINDDVNIVLGRTSRVYAGGVEIPSENIDGVNLAELAVLEFDIDLVAVFQGRIDLDNVSVDGLQVNIVRQRDGSTSWTDEDRVEIPERTTEAETPQADDEASGGLSGFLRAHTVAFSSIGLVILNEPTGFEFVFDLEYLNLDQLDGGARIGLTSRGTVNGQSFAIEGDYPSGQPFTTLATFGAMTLRYDGAPFPVMEGGGHSAHVSLDTGEIGDLLDILRLNRVLEGRGVMSAEITRKPGVLGIADFAATLDLAEGQQFKAVGDVENLGKLQGFELTFDGRFHPEGAPPPVADDLKDLKLTGVHAYIVAEGNSLEFEELNLSTNAFDQGLDNIGPLTIGTIRRTEDGLLAVEDVTLQAGPEENPILTASGGIRNFLELKDLDLSGALTLRASEVFPTADPAMTADFGGVTAEFSLDDAPGHLSLNKFSARSFDTEIWSLDVDARLGDISHLNDLDFELAFGVAETARFLGALNLEEIDAGAMEVALAAHREGKVLSTGFDLVAGSSQINASMSVSAENSRPRVDGSVLSDRLDIADIRNAVAALVELGKLDDELTDDPDVQPLVLPKEEAPEDDIQPLVLPKEDRKPTDMFDLEELLVETDLKLVIDFQEIVGQQGISSLSSELTAQDGTARLGPIEMSYGGGYFKVGAEMDLVESPDRVSVAGATSGWDFGAILDAVGLGIKAHGKLRGNFAVTGSIKSGAAFLNSMAGTASISMSNGDISTSLLELAGLGIFPWLFSEELAQGYTEIVCVVAPVRVNAGNVTFDSVVAETKSVQLVAHGHVDWIGDTIAVRAEPRRVGKPLSRSAWPFDVTGKLSEPKFKLDIGGSRPRIAGQPRELSADRQPCVPDLKQIE